MTISQNIKARLKRLRAAQGGSTAVEFAMVALPLVFGIFATLEMALIIVASVSIDNASAQAARKIRMGIFTQANSSMNSFKQEICDHMNFFAATCMDDIQIDVKTYNNFALVPTTDPIAGGEFDSTDMAYQIGTGSSIQLVRVYYHWTLITPFLKGGVTSLNNGDAVLSTKIIFKNEPF